MAVVVRLSNTRIDKHLGASVCLFEKSRHRSDWDLHGLSCDPSDGPTRLLRLELENHTRKPG